MLTIHSLIKTNLFPRSPKINKVDIKLNYINEPGNLSDQV